MVLDAVALHIERHVGLMQKVIRKVLLDHVALVSKTHDELVDAERRVQFHDVPEDRLRADFQHGLRPAARFLGDARALAAGENDAFHTPRLLRARYCAICASENLTMSSPAACARYQSAVHATDSAIPRQGRHPGVPSASPDDNVKARASSGCGP